jgi:hypothetical protein
MAAASGGAVLPAATTAKASHGQQAAASAMTAGETNKLQKNDAQVEKHAEAANGTLDMHKKGGPLGPALRAAAAATAPSPQDAAHKQGVAGA